MYKFLLEALTGGKGEGARLEDGDGRERGKGDGKGSGVGKRGKGKEKGKAGGWRESGNGERALLRGRSGSMMTIKQHENQTKQIAVQMLTCLFIPRTSQTRKM